jgi:hypothetical protein
MVLFTVIWEKLDRSILNGAVSTYEAVAPVGRAPVLERRSGHEDTYISKILPTAAAIELRKTKDLRDAVSMGWQLGV